MDPGGLQDLRHVHRGWKIGEVPKGRRARPHGHGVGGIEAKSAISIRWASTDLCGSGLHWVSLRNLSA